MWTYIEIDGKLYVTQEDYLNMVKYYENSLSAERNGAKEDKKELREEIKELKTKINRVIDLFKRWDSSDLYDYIDDLDYEKI